jgi:tetratricopeptide (TPR) repeat protein
MLTQLLQTLTTERSGWRKASRCSNLRSALALAMLVGLGTAFASGQTNAASVLRDDERLTQREAKAYYERGVSQVQKQQWEEAIRDLSEAARLNPEDAMTYFYRGCARFARGDMDMAVSDFDQVLLFQSTNSEAIFNRGTARRAQGELDKAILDFTECLRLSPKHALAYFSRAASYGAKGQRDKEIADWNDGLRLAPNDARALLARGHTFVVTGQFDKAVVDFKKVIQLGPTNGDGYNDLAWLRATCPRASVRDGKEAVEAATAACKLSNWSRWEWIDTLAAGYAEAGDFKGAVEYQKKAIAMSGVSEQDRGLMQRRLAFYERKQPYREGQGK